LRYKNGGQPVLGCPEVFDKKFFVIFFDKGYFVKYVFFPLSSFFPKSAIRELRIMLKTACFLKISVSTFFFLSFSLIKQEFVF